MPGPASSYRPEYATRIVEFCKDGYSLTAFAGHISVAPRTLRKWQQVHPEFREACDIAKARACLWWEGKLRDLGDGQGTPRATIFALCNLGPDSWTEKDDGAAGITITLNTNVGRASTPAIEVNSRPALGYSVPGDGDDAAEPAALPGPDDSTSA